MCAPKAHRHPMQMGATSDDWSTLRLGATACPSDAGSEQDMQDREVEVNDRGP